MMKKRMITIGCSLLLLTAMLGGCNTSKKAEEQTTENKAATVSVDYGKGFEESGMLADVTPSDYVKLCDYKNLEIPKDEVTATNDEVTAQISVLVQSFQVKDRKVKKGDTANIDYVGKVDGKEFDGGSDEGYDLSIGSGTFIEGFEDQIIGHKPGETFTVKVTFPKDYQSEDLAGKDAEFTTTVNYIVPDLDKDVDDDFVKDNMKAAYGFSSVKDMKTQVKERLEENKKYDYILKYLVEHSKYEEIPDKLVNDRLDVVVEGLESQMAAQGNSIEDYLNNYGYEDVDGLRDAYRDACEDTVKTCLAVDCLAKEEGLAVTEKDISEYFGGENYAVYTASYPQSYINRSVLNNMAVKNVLESAKIK